MRLIDEMVLVFPTQGFDPDLQRDFSACVCLISVLVGLSPSPELGAVQLFWMYGLYVFPRRAVAPVARVRLMMCIFLARFPFALPAGLSPCPGTVWSEPGRSEWLCLGSQNQIQTVFLLIFPTCPILCRITNFGPDL